MADNPGFPESPSRRGVVAAAGGAGLAAVLTACGSGSDSAAGSKRGADSPSSGGASTGAGAPSSDPTTSAAAGGGGTALARTSEIPVGGGKVFAAQKVVVTQPTAGQFKAFSAVCTHQGCTVAGVADGVISCPCHGSKFHVADGSVADGPASAPLPAKQVTVSGGEVTLA
ncbi:Rieske (2Fe-2S) protein [Streptomyces sp. V4-01]|uniref:Cytochrome bc1 complex Rieske iron-sulfur subunit n=1 Tax=Actinacidiphila polyblastidii TaxID=3110430 RepID=A0ABU7PL48_9ACTN|nr:Rieske (2Fe-2S) protein [Streptomyces sp. V4-01]